MTYLKACSLDPHPGKHDTLRRAARRTLAGLLASAAFATAWAQGTPQNLPRQPLGAGMHIIQAQIARTPEQREIGLMHRKDMPANEGMLFIFDEPATQCFWMRNTLLPLSTAFVADDGSIVNIEEMAPMTEVSHCSKRPVRYVLEMNKGWFAKVGFKSGSRITGAPFTR